MTTEVLPGVTMDPKDESTLEELFGVTSNAEELVRGNAQRYTPAQLATAKKKVNHELTSLLYTGGAKMITDEHGQSRWATDEPREVKPELEEAIGHPIETAVVRGSGRGAMISYVFESGRGLGKDVIPFSQVFGSDAERQQAKAEPTPEGVLREAESEVQKVLREAKEEAEKIAHKAREEAEKAIRAAEEEAEDIRQRAQTEAVATAEKADGDDPEADAKTAAARSGSSRSKRSSSKAK